MVSGTACTPEEEYVSVHLNDLIFHSQSNHSNHLCKAHLIFAAYIKCPLVSHMLCTLCACQVSIHVNTSALCNQGISSPRGLSNQL